MYVIGIDPGPVTGLVRLHLLREPDRTVLMGSEPGGGLQALQATPGVLTSVLEALSDGIGQAVAYERFIVGPRAARSRTPQAGVSTRVVVATVDNWARTRCKVHDRSAADVKPWATDARLDAIGLLELTKGMRHARDAARHALFCAVKDYGLPDPLSRKASL